MSTCTEPRCGHPQTSAGHPRKGWVRVNIAGSPPARWYCSTACAAAALDGRATAELTGIRTDVGACPTCATRHDLGHRCRSCGHTPPRVTFAYPVRPFDAGPEEQPRLTALQERQQRLRDLGVTTGEVRAWARTAGRNVPDRGPLNPDVVDAYLDQHQTQEAAS